MYKKTTRFRERLPVRSRAAVNVALTGSVDRVSLWQCCVDVDRCQQTFGDLAEHSGFAVCPFGKPKEGKLRVCKVDAEGS